jgi:hypothetical protein
MVAQLTALKRHSRTLCRLQPHRSTQRCGSEHVVCSLVDVPPPEKFRRQIEAG